MRLVLAQQADQHGQLFGQHLKLRVQLLPRRERRVQQPLELLKVLLKSLAALAELSGQHLPDVRLVDLQVLLGDDQLSLQNLAVQQRPAVDVLLDQLSDAVLQRLSISISIRIIGTRLSFCYSKQVMALKSRYSRSS